VEVLVTTSQPEARDFADIAGKSLADVGLQVGLTVLRPGQDGRAVLAAMAANGVKYVVPLVLSMVVVGLVVVVGVGVQVVMVVGIVVVVVVVVWWWLWCGGGGGPVAVSSIF
jgi:hypothetical protein